MNITVDLGQVLTAGALGALAWGFKLFVREMRQMRADVTQLQLWAARRFGFEPSTGRDESEA